ncbi:hypothetical protein BST63_16465 [Bradyrhizobium canariense]|uniref:Uncharacterized protein n=1 Tax=Bradyrhizobium canariense TaxID=255045 RepID=A0ABX3X3K8_9BRAD|nr:hypothetical protein BSR47_21010 [Bradyrhizobium canariense]OSJ28749.1 hypothetical protein BST63_16465 [Bradyrhizobium canariense]
MPNEFFTVQSMLTLSGATGATFVICNGLQTAFNFNPKWLGLLVAQIIVLAGVVASGGAGPMPYLVGVINGFLVYCSAAGATSAVGGGGAPPIARGQVPGQDAPLTPARRGFLTPWF